MQTIHSFCERLLQRFPLEAGVAPGFTILDDETAKALLREAIDATLLEATDGSSPAQRRRCMTVIPYAAEERFDDVLRARRSIERRWLVSATRIDLGEHDDELAGLEAAYRARLRRARGGDASTTATATWPMSSATRNWCACATP